MINPQDRRMALHSEALSVILVAIIILIVYIFPLVSIVAEEGLSVRYIPVVKVESFYLGTPIGKTRIEQEVAVYVLAYLCNESSVTGNSWRKG